MRGASAKGLVYSLAPLLAGVLVAGGCQSETGLTRGAQTSEQSEVCLDTCTWAGDGACDDGGEGAEYAVCDYGTDCADCGPRDPGGCAPSCEYDGVSVECGSDGCGGSCGECPAGQVCGWDGVCFECEGSCEGRVCGDDGCGGSCGECSDGEICDWDGGCTVCEPDCAGRECGWDGCEGSCGECAPPAECDWEGHCVVCEPDCGGRACGDDGCGGSCGDCSGGTYCNATTGQCDGTAMCNDSCSWAGDGDCDDGGRGCDYSLCEFGSDCIDCGPRTEADRLPEGEGCTPSD